jgi:hypothetical protein
MFIIGASKTCAFLLVVSLPRNSPTLLMRVLETVAAREIPHGIKADVDPPDQRAPQAPAGPSEVLIAPIPSLGIGALSHMLLPPRIVAFSSAVIWSRRVAMTISVTVVWSTARLLGFLPCCRATK